MFFRSSIIKILFIKLGRQYLETLLFIKLGRQLYLETLLFIKLGRHYLETPKHNTFSDTLFVNAKFAVKNSFKLVNFLYFEHPVLKKIQFAN